MKIAFVDIKFHEKTQSSNFFHELLLEIGSVDHFYYEYGDIGLIQNLCDKNYDLYILFQCEFFAPYFQFHGKRVVIIPMWDNCIGLKRDYWKILKNTRSINFSAALSAQQSKSGIENITVKYYPDPNQYKPVTDYSDLNLFFWQRRPDLGIDINFVKKLFYGAPLSKFNLHNVPDINFDDSKLDYHNINLSSWFEDKQKFNEFFENFNIYVASRPYEGIGFGFLDAMARGMCVAAPNSATHNEYIIDGRNGYLFDPNVRDAFGPQPIRPSPNTVRELGQCARYECETGFKKWKEFRQEIKWFISTTPKPEIITLKNKRDANLMLKMGIEFISRRKKFITLYNQTFYKYLSKKKIQKALAAYTRLAERINDVADI